MTTNLADLTDAPVVVEAIVEELDPKVELLSRLGAVVGPQALLATTTSSVSVAELGALSGLAGRLVGLHVFNPVPRMDLVEVVVPDGVPDDVRQRVFAFVDELAASTLSASKADTSEVEAVDRLVDLAADT